ncbi:MAG: hypothetical protein SPL80_04025, partial [Bacilli bacterium]|nr:hypothetical protein [Bacilli bacterium]
AKIAKSGAFAHFVSDSLLELGGLMNPLKYYLKRRESLCCFEPPYAENRTYGGVRGWMELKGHHSTLIYKKPADIAAGKVSFVSVRLDSE